MSAPSSLSGGSRRRVLVLDGSAEEVAAIREAAWRPGGFEATVDDTTNPAEAARWLTMREYSLVVVHATRREVGLDVLRICAFWNPLAKRVLVTYASDSPGPTDSMRDADPDLVVQGPLDRERAVFAMRGLSTRRPQGPT